MSYLSGDVSSGIWFSIAIVDVQTVGVGLRKSLSHTLLQRGDQKCGSNLKRFEPFTDKPLKRLREHDVFGFAPR
jgi:hypothetical protein